MKADRLSECRKAQSLKKLAGKMLDEASPDSRKAGSNLSASDRVAQTILQDIRGGRLVPGQHLLEPELTERLGISRGSLREALKHLAAGGIITLNRYRGAYIATLDRKSVFDLLDTLEPMARLGARLAAKNCRDARDRKRILDAAKFLGNVQALGNRGDYLNGRRKFYDVMLEIGGNQELARVIPLSRTDIFRAQVETRQSEKQRKRHADGYRKIAEAITRSDVDAADRAMAEHFSGTRETMEELPEDVFPPAKS